MFKDDFHLHLVDLGMTEREAKLYIALLSRPESTPAELHHLSGIVRNKTYETLEQMVQRGFCTERREGRKKYYRAISPETLQEALQRQWQREMEQKVSTLHAKEDVFRTLSEYAVSLKPHDQILEKIEVIRNSNHINARLIELSRNTKHEILSFSRSPYVSHQSPSFAEEQNQVQADCMQRGVKQHTLYMYEREVWPWLSRSVLERCESAGEEVRIASYLPIKMIVFDQKTVVLHLPSFPGKGIPDFTALVIDDPGFINMCMMTFRFIWETAQPYETWRAQQGSHQDSPADIHG